MNKVMLTEDILMLDDAVNVVKCAAAGAISIFVGTTKDTFDGKTVERLEYEAYDKMAYNILEQLCLEMREKWLLKHICIMHRLGIVPISETSVIIAISSVHRSESLEAVQYCINKLKSTVPIWKKEIYSDGGSVWKENTECIWKS